MEEIGEFTVGVVCIILIIFCITGAMYILTWATGSLGHQQLIEKCQESLPRNQRCILKAVPSNQQGDET